MIIVVLFGIAAFFLIGSLLLFICHPRLTIDENNSQDEDDTRYW